jgi:hypothetical protein
MIDAVTPVVERVTRKRFFGVPLWGDGYESERARDCFQQAILMLCEKFARVAAGIDPPIQSLEKYAARVAHNTVTNVVRPPNWTRLKHQVLRVISQHSAFATWDHPQFGTVCGYAGWRTQKDLKAHGSLVRLRQFTSELRTEAVFATRWDNMRRPHWQKVLELVFDAGSGPIEMTTLINFLAEVLEVGGDIPLDPESDDD